MDKNYYDPLETARNYIETGCKKSAAPAYRLLLLGIMAGAFIAFAAQGSNAAIHTITSVGLGKTIAGALFATGLMMVVISGAELFTGNTLIIVSCLERKARWIHMLRNWLYVYVGNFLGSMLIVLLILYSGQFDFSSGMLGGFTIKVAAYKIGLTFYEAFYMGILCNWLVCMAVWMASASKDITGKLFSIFFPIWLFITSGFEHCIANMYYIPAGILAKANPVWFQQAIAMGVTPDQINILNWGSFLGNLIPVTLGNIVGGSIFVGMVYWGSFLYQEKSIKLSGLNHFPEMTHLQEHGGKRHAV